MKIAILSDIHGNIAALEAVLQDVSAHGVDRIVNLGDSLSGPFDARGTADRLMTLGLPTVSGNHDRALWDRPRDEMGLWEAWIIDDLTPGHIDWLRALPLTVTLGDVFLCHATPNADDENWLDRRGPAQRLVARDRDGIVARLGTVTAPVVCCGHTHTPRVVRLGRQMIVNPGSVGCPAYLDTRSDPPFIHETGAPDARYAILEQAGNGWAVSHRSVPYDSREMARLARRKDAESWAIAVEQGWFSTEG